MEKPIEEIRTHFSKYIRELEEPILILKRSEPVAVLSPLTTMEMLFGHVKAGKAAPEVYIRKMLGLGHQSLVDGRVIVTPMDIVMFQQNFSLSSK